MLTVTKRFTFDSAHHLPNHTGLCKFLHGHTYILEVTVGAGDAGLELFHEQGFFIDLKYLKDLVGDVLDRYDHTDLNKEIDTNPTAERLVMRLWGDIQANLPESVELVKLRLNETPNGWVTYTGSDPTFDHRVVL